MNRIRIIYSPHTADPQFLHELAEAMVVAQLTVAQAVWTAQVQVMRAMLTAQFNYMVTVRRAAFRAR